MQEDAEYILLHDFLIENFRYYIASNKDITEKMCKIMKIIKEGE